MRGLIFHGERDVRVEDVPAPRIEQPTDAVVRVRVAAVCGSDLHVYHGRERGLEPGTVMGHEFVGEVVEAGPAVRGVRAGDVVLSPFSTSCGTCFFCELGLTARCVHGQLFGWISRGFGLHGAQAEFVRVPLAGTTLVALPPGIDPEEGLLLGDVLATGYQCARSAGVQAEGVYAVVGCGPVGLMAVIGARELGARTVFAVDSVPERLELARRFGATPIDRSGEDPATRIREVTSGRGADAVMEAVGSSAAARLAIDLLRPGGTLSIVGVHTEERFPFSPAEAYDKNLTLRIGRCSARAVLADLISIVQSKRHDLRSIVTHRLPLERAAEAYAIFDGKRDGCVKVVLNPNTDNS